MRTQNRLYRLTSAIAIAGLFAQVLPQPVLAQPAAPPPANALDQQGGDPPTRVGALSQMTGSVSFHTQDETQWNAATPNYPVVQGDSFWTQPGAQVGIQVSASLIAMAPQTELDVASLTDTAFQGTLPQGEVYARIQAASPNETYAVQTPRGLVTLSSPGRYSVTSGDTQAPTLITVVQGSAHITGPGVELDVAANQTASVTGTDTFQAQVGPAQRDPFLTAMLAREQPPRPQPQAVAPPPVVAAMPGGDSLAEYGTWSDSSEYGNVWYPQVAAGWVPYREGHWAYVAPWGWTWVDSDPWGFAPFHYGRWAEIGGRWGWIPGNAVVAEPPVYAPALVTFFGFGAGVAVGVGIGAALAGGNIGWCPLGPREVYHPWYHASPNYVRNVNITHVTNVTNITTINRNVTINNFANRGAATVVPASAMAGSRPIVGVAQHVAPGQFAQARPVFGTQPIRPAATTAGVTPAVAREYHLAAPPAGARPAAPGPSIRATPAVVTPGAAGAAAAAVHPGMPALHNPSPGAAPAAAGTRPFTATPELRTPQAPGHVGPPPIQHEQPVVATPGGVPHAPGAAEPATIAHPGAAVATPGGVPHAPGTPEPATITHPGAAVATPGGVPHAPGAAERATIAHPGAAVATPGGVPHAPGTPEPATITHPGAAVATPGGVPHAPGAAEPATIAHPGAAVATPGGVPHAPGAAEPATIAHPGAEVRAPGAVPRGPGTATPATITHTAPPPAVHPEAISPPHAAPTTASPAVVHPAAPVVHAPEPAVVHPVAPPVVHAPPPAQAVVAHPAAPPPSVVHAPQPAPQVVHAAPPPQAPHPAPAAAAVHAPPPQAHPTPAQHEEKKPGQP